jgi:hypothetical protein
MQIAQLSPQMLARQQHAARDQQRLAKFGVVADALRSPARSGEIVKMGRRQVNRWRVFKLCSPDYIREWSHLLEDPAAAAKVLEDPSPWAGQLRQNSPFVEAVRALNAA